MQAAGIEHVNLTVTDPERSAALLMVLFGWHERWRGPARDGGETRHIGTADAYIALYAPPPGSTEAARFAKGMPLNHVGVQVDDLDAVEARVVTAGLHPFAHADYPPGRRFYFLDFDGIEFEVVSYSG